MSKFIIIEETKLPEINSSSALPVLNEYTNFDLTSQEDSSEPENDSNAQTKENPDTQSSESFTGIRKNLFHERYRNLTIQSRNNNVPSNVFCSDRDFLSGD